jgi:hypothetical protein
LVIETLFVLMPICLLEIMALSKFWLIFMLLFFGTTLVGLFVFIPGTISFLSSKISPNKNFSFYIITLFSILLGIIHVFYYLNTSDLVANGLGTIYRIIFSCLTIGLAISLSIGASVDINFEKQNILILIASIGSYFFYFGILLIFCLISIKICHINTERTYTWWAGIWHGIFVLPHWIASWFLDDIYCKAPNSTIAYSIWWWISFIFVGLGIFSTRKNRDS